MREEKAVSRAWENCPACGYQNEQNEARCEKCGRRLRPSQHWASAPPAPAHLSSRQAGMVRNTLAPPAAEDPEMPEHPGKTAGAPRPAAPRHENFRGQLSSRVQNFRSRRLNGNLQFEEEERLRNKIIPFEAISSLPAQMPGPSRAQRQPRQVRPQIQQQALDFPAAPDEMESFLALPVAPFRLRLIGHICDFTLSLAALLVFLLPLKLLAGPVVLNRLLLMGSIGAYLLLVLLYGLLFLYLAGATPTMKWMGLRLVNFDGMPPPRRQLLCRFLGAIASVGSFFLGFLWAAVDEEGLSWHDRISKTFLTRE
jgi:uncharacterized RDD family membrane protein YckC